MYAPHPRYDSGLAKIEVDALVTRVLFTVSLACALGGVLLVLLQYERLSRDAIVGILSVPTGVGLSVAAGAWLTSRGRFAFGVACWVGGAYLGTTAFALLTGIGIHSIVLGFYGVIVIIAGASIGARAAVVVAAVCAATVLAMYGAELRGDLPGAAAIGSMPLATRVTAQLLILIAAAAFGVTLSRVLLASLRTAREQERRFAGLLAIAADWYWEQDAELRYTRVSNGVERVLGMPAAALIGRACAELVDTGEAPAHWEQHFDTLRQRSPFKDFIVRRSTADGREIFVSLSGEPVFDDAGHFTGYWGTGRDVTSEASAQRALEASERRFRALFDLLPSAVVVHREGRVLRVNQAAATVFGYRTPEAMAGLSVYALNHPTSVEVSRQRIADIGMLPPGTVLPTSAELHMQHRDGSDLFMQAFGARIELPDGGAILSIYFDVTERRRSEARLRYKEAMLSRLFEAGPEYMTVSDVATSRLHLVNDGFTRLTGWRREEALGHSALELGIWFDPDHRDRLVEEMRREGTARDVPVTLRRRDGSLLWALMSASSFLLDGAEYLVATARDITRSESERMEYEAILANASVGIAVTRNHRIEHVNPRLERMFGWAPGALAGQSTSVVWPSEDDWQRMVASTEGQLARGDTVDLERVARRRDGSLFWARVRGCVIDRADPNGGGTVWIVEDVTERREFEQRLAEAKEMAEAASRAKTEFLANTSHEIRTPLNGLLGLARLALDPNVGPARQREYLRLILESGESLSGIMSDILDLSKVEAGKLVIEDIDFDLHELLSAVLASHRGLVGERPLAFELNLAAGLPRWVRGDPVRVRQIVSNFVANAVKFTPSGRVELQASPAGGGRVRIGVRDDGIGMDEATLARLFEPFTQADPSTTRRFGGTGLGLSICRQLALLLNGSIGVHSAPGAGSTFWVELPLPQVVAGAGIEALGAEDLQPLAGTRVLIVEDNAVNLLIAETFVSNWGAVTASATDGRQALAAVRAAAADGAPFDAVLMDMHMPVMSGYEATAQLRNDYSPDELPVIALTAAALTAEKERCLSLGVNDFLTKPIDAARLLDTLLRWTRRALAASTER